MVTLEGNFVLLLENRKPDLWRNLSEPQIESQACMQCVLQLSPTKYHSPPPVSFTKVHTQPSAFFFFFLRLPKATKWLQSLGVISNQCLHQRGLWGTNAWAHLEPGDMSNPAVLSPYPGLMFAPDSNVLFQTTKRTGPWKFLVPKHSLKTMPFNFCLCIYCCSCPLSCLLI